MNRMTHSGESIFKTYACREKVTVLLLMIVFLFVVGMSATFFILSVGKPYMGVNLSFENPGWVVAVVDRNGLANKAGIQEGDKLTEINGKSADIFLEKYRKLGSVFGVMFREMTVVDEHGQLKSVVLKESSAQIGLWIEQIAWVVVSLLFWVTGLYVFLKKPDKAPALLLLLFGLTLGVALSGNMAAAIGIPAALQSHIIASVIGPWLLLHFFLVLPEERSGLSSNPFVYFIYLPVVITIMLYPLVGWVENQPVQWFRNFRLFEYGFGILAAVGVTIFNYFGSNSIKTKQQSRIVLGSSICALFPLLLFNIIPSAVWRETSGFGILFFGFIPLGLGYAVVSQKLMDIDVIVRRGLIYGTVTLVMAGILSVVVFSVMAFPDAFGTGEKVLVALAAGGLAAVLFGPAKDGIEILVDRLFYKDRYDYRQIITALGNSLKLVQDINKISRVLVGTAVHRLNLAGGCLFVRAQSGPFEVASCQGIFANEAREERLLNLVYQRSCQIEFPSPATSADPGVAFLVPLVAGDKEVGILCLAHKISRQQISADDMYLLQGIASVGAIALHSAMLVRDVSVRDTFVSIASHELRTPLTAVVGYADLLLRHDPPEETRKQWLQIILASGLKITDMVDDLLDVSRIRSGRIGLKVEKIQLPPILSEEVNVARAITNKHQFAVGTEPDLRDVFIDRSKFGQIIANLLNNAVKYSPKGGRITVKARNDLAHDRVVVSVADEGIGIGSEDKESLFKTFQRIQRPETVGIRGIGLGLYIVKEWTEAMGGSVWFESELNKGTTFFVAVPARQAEKIPDVG